MNAKINRRLIELEAAAATTQGPAIYISGLSESTMQELAAARDANGKYDASTLSDAALREFLDALDAADATR